MSLSVIIPSKNVRNVMSCITAIRKADREPWLIVIDDGIDISLRMQILTPARFIGGVKPFVYARNCNLGIQAAGTHDVILLNDDALLETPGGFTAMQRAAVEYPEFGIISAVTNISGNADQQPRPRGHAPRDAGNRSVAFVCVLIPRRTIELVGLLDERFTEYGWEDNDYCRRVRAAGLKVGIFDGCFVDHGSLRSTFRGDPRAHRDISAGAAIYRKKWGDLA